MWVFVPVGYGHRFTCCPGPPDDAVDSRSQIPSPGLLCCLAGPGSGKVCWGRLAGSGFAIGAPSIATISVLVGGGTGRPRVVDGQVEVRRILDMAVQIDDRIVDGGPAASFGAALRELLENPELIDW